MKKTKKRSHPLITLVALISVIALSFTGVGCENGYGDIYNDTPNPKPGYYYKVSDSIPVPGGGSLKAYLERQREGSLSGDALTTRYYLRNEYTGSATVREIRATWTVRAEFRRLAQESVEGGVATEANYSFYDGKQTFKTTVSIAPTSKYEYSTIEDSHYWSNTNGAKDVYHGPNTYQLSPYKQLNAHSLTNTAELKISGHSTPLVVSVAT